MSRRVVAAAALVLASVLRFGAADANAQELRLSQDSRVSFLASDNAPLAVQPPMAVEAEPAPAEVVKPSFDPNRNKMLLPLYASTAILQALDVHSTMQVLKYGGGEGNPMLQGIVANRPAFIAAKAAVAASTIYAVSRIGKRSKLGAIVTTAAINSVYAMVVSHNYKLARDMR